MQFNTFILSNLNTTLFKSFLTSSFIAALTFSTSIAQATLKTQVIDQGIVLDEGCTQDCVLPEIDYSYSISTDIQPKVVDGKYVMHITVVYVENPNKDNFDSNEVDFPFHPVSGIYPTDISKDSVNFADFIGSLRDYIDGIPLTSLSSGVVESLITQAAKKSMRNES